MYIDRDEQGNIVSTYACKQREDQEFLTIEALIEQLNSQELKWEHGYGSL